MNKQFIKQQAYAYKQIKSLLPAVYSSLALALHESCGTSIEDIEYIFSESQRIWHEHSGSIEDMIRKCEDELGIEVRER